MDEEFGAIPALIPPGPSPSAGSWPNGFDPGYEAYRQALIAFYRSEGSFQRAENLAKGWSDLDASDRRVIDALRAAFERIAA